MIQQQYGQAVADAGGNATVIVRGPWRNGTRWSVGQAILKGTPAGGTVGCTAELYRSAVIPGCLMGTSLIANDDTMEGLAGDELQPGDQLIVVFAGLAPGTLAYVNLRATELVGQ